MLIAAASGRALAASARRGGFAPLVADRFGDIDTLAVAERHALADLARPIDGDKLLTTLARLADDRAPIGVVCGTGFEDRSDLLTRLGEHWPLLGNDPRTVAILKDPIVFADLCREVQVLHPEISLYPPVEAEGWLVKRAGGAGGRHIRAPSDGATGEGSYYQRRIPGRPVSALLLGDGQQMMVLGFSEQWSAPTPRHLYRYGGAVRPATIEMSLPVAMEAAIRRLNARLPLKGLNSVDFLVDDGVFHLLEVNPRPSATFDLFELEEGSLFALHVAACNGHLPERVPPLAGAAAGAIVYADRAIASVPAVDWPAWTSDRPGAGSRIDRDEPVCSVFARAATAGAAKRLLDERCTAVRAVLWGAP